MRRCRCIVADAPLQVRRQRALLRPAAGRRPARERTDLGAASLGRATGRAGRASHAAWTSTLRARGGNAIGPRLSRGLRSGGERELARRCEGRALDGWLRGVGPERGKILSRPAEWKPRCKNKPRWDNDLGSSSAVVGALGHRAPRPPCGETAGRPGRPSAAGAVRRARRCPRRAGTGRTRPRTGAGGRPTWGSPLPSGRRRR